MKQFDIVIIGLGIMGSAALWNLSRSGLRIAGVESGGPLHTKGSSHGRTRIFRRAYWEGEAYLPLLNLAHMGWERLQSSSDKPLLVRTGGVFIGQRTTNIVRGSLLTAQQGNIAHESWDAATLRRHLPQFQVSDDMHAVFEPGAYSIAAEDARLHMLTEAVGNGAEIRFGESVESLHGTGDGVCVTLKSGLRIDAGAAIVTIGPWIARKLLAELGPCVTPNRVPIFWFKPRSGAESRFEAEHFPVFLYECGDGALLYGIPSGASGEAGVKIGFHNRQQFPGHPDSAAPPIDDAISGQIASYVSRIFPDLLPQPVKGTWCFYTMSIDESFLIGESEEFPSVYYASACSGHGFKFATGIGEVLACLAQKQASPVDIGCFHRGRFDNPGTTPNT